MRLQGEILVLTNPSDELHYSIKWAQKNPRIGTAVISIHPQAFTDKNNKPDPVKLDKMEKTVKYIINHKQTYGEIVTFQSWYNYTSQ